MTQLTSGRHILLAIMALNVGLNPHKDIRWVTDPARKSIELFAQGKIDAFMAFSLEQLELRARKVGQVLVNTTFGAAVVAVFLLYGRKQPRVRAQTPLLERIEEGAEDVTLRRNCVQCGVWSIGAQRPFSDT